MRQWCANTISPAGQSEVLTIFHCDEIAYVRHLTALSPRYSGKSTKGELFDWMSLCFFEPPSEKFVLVRDAVDGWRKPDSERRQSMNVNKRIFF